MGYFGFGDEASMAKHLDSFGVHSDQQKQMSQSLDPSQIAQVIGDVLGSLASLGSSLFFLITVLLFMTLDAYGFPAKLEAARTAVPA